MNNKKLLLALMAMYAAGASAQQLKDGYITWGVDGQKFAEHVAQWKASADKKVNEDDNFFISRVKPRARFRNQNTQVDNTLTQENDKRLQAWLPFSDPGKNGLPDGVFDSEVFSMWNYVDHWGDWTAPLGRIPASLLDVAHKNGVAVTPVASIPWGTIPYAWSNALINISNMDAASAAQFLHYYGIDGLGYNSEFQSLGLSNIRRLRTFHAALVKAAKPNNPIFENMWYDGTDDLGQISFDRGLGSHNDETFGDKDNVRTSLFLNYNWNGLNLQASVNKAIEMGRDPMELYCGINMQGGQPSTNWTKLRNYRLGIGLWGAHSKNMFWESRNEKGSSPEVQQRTYLDRIERWFTGGSKNPANLPPMQSTLKYNADNFDFPGMSSMMSAKSSLSWNLDEEPFVTYFNLGNGKFFNLDGKTVRSKEWYNVGMQDYLPTWRWWFSSELLTKNVPASGLEAQFTWDDAYFGGSTVRVYGNTDNEYLHLFKTDYAMKTGDKIAVRYKVKGGKADLALALRAKGEEATAIDEANFKLMEAATAYDDEVWQEKTFTVGDELNGKSLALVALHFQNAQNLNLYMGEFSIQRGAAVAPAAPTVTLSKVLSYSKDGVDGKVIFNMPNSKPADEPCYNLDVKTAYFKIYAKQKGGESVFIGTTTSWAGMVYSMPIDNNGEKFVQFGASAVGLDMKTESVIAWGEELPLSTYVYDDAVTANKTVIKPNEEFKMNYVDPQHKEGKWVLKLNGEEKFSGEGKEVSVPGLAEIGSYDLELTGVTYDANGVELASSTRSIPSFIQVSPETIGALPEIKTLTANAQADGNTVSVSVDEAVNLAYTSRKADGTASQGIKLKEKPLAVRTSELGLSNMNTSWTYAYWIKYNEVNDWHQIFDVRNPRTSWPMNNWGTVWSHYDGKQKELTITLRSTISNGSVEHSQTFNVDFQPGAWTHLALGFEYVAGKGTTSHLFLNGKELTPTKWKFGSRTGYGRNPNYQNIQAWWAENYLFLGVGRHQTAAMNATADDIKFFNKCLTEAEVKQTMYSNDKTEAGLAGFWDFEEPAVNQEFNNLVGEAKMMHGELVAGTLEGQSVFQKGDAETDAGSPFVAGSAFKVETKATWSARKATFSDEVNNAEDGTAKVKFSQPGEYIVTLTLENAHGKDTKQFHVIKVEGTTGIALNTASELKAYTVGQDVLVELAEAGNYNVQIFSVEGRLATQQAGNFHSGNVVRVHLPQTGVYILRVQKDGKQVHSAKLLRK